MKKIKLQIDYEKSCLYSEDIHCIKSIFKDRGYDITYEQAYILFCEYDNEYYDHEIESDEDYWNKLKTFWKED